MKQLKNIGVFCRVIGTDIKKKKGYVYAITKMNV
jgi:hypothetical protein